MHRLVSACPFDAREMHAMKANFACWAKMPYWTAEEAVCLLLELEPGVSPRYLDDDYEAYEVEYPRLLILAQRAFDDGQIGHPGTPAQWLDWAEKNVDQIPPELAERVHYFWPEKQSAASVKICAETACMNKLIAMMKVSLDNPQPKDEIQTKHFPGLPTKSFRRAWAAAIREAKASKWARPGRRKNRNR
jgi:hypothetical protein